MNTADGENAMPENGVLCAICHQERPRREILSGETLPAEAQRAIRAQASDWDSTDYLCVSCLARILTDPPGDEASPAAPDHPATGEQTPFDTLHQPRTPGEHISDLVAGFVGSWMFLLTQFVVIAVWIAFNAIAIYRYRFDPYPFIFLNLVLSWAAALQAPLVLMSQNRQDTRDRERDENEFRTNLDAEREIRELHRKLDQILLDHWPQLLDIHRQQVQLMAELSQRQNNMPGEESDA